MFTKNFKTNAIIAVTLGFRETEGSFKPALSDVYNDVSVSSTFQPIDDLLNSYNTRSFTKKSMNTSKDYCFGVCFGDGTSEPTPDDVCLSGTHHTGITSANCIKDVTYSVDDNGDYILTANYTITNTTDADITIAEVGMAQSGTYFKGGYNYYLPVLVERTLLETPITIPVDNVGKVTYTIRLSGLPSA